MCNGDHLHLPCLHCQPHSYIKMVQHLIEKCLLFHMSRDDCIKALAKNAGVQPLVTFTVWKELMKENEGFFQEYFHTISPKSFSYRSIDQRMLNYRRKQWRR